MSVVVPLYNHARYIGGAVASILAQGPIVREIVVIDDGSTDDSAQIMQALAAKDPRIRFRSQANQGAHATLNAALAEATGELAAILNSDDAYLPGRLDTLADMLDDQPDASIAASQLTFMDGAGQASANEWHDRAWAFHRNGAAMGVALVNGNFLMTTSNFVFRRALLDEIGSFASLRYAHDLDFALRALAFGKRIVVLDDALLRYRVHASNTIAEDHRAVRAEWAMVTAGYLTLLWDRPGAPPIDWAKASAMQDVLQRHELARAVALIMAYLRRHDAAPLERSPLLADSGFRFHVREWV